MTPGEAIGAAAAHKADLAIHRRQANRVRHYVPFFAVPRGRLHMAVCGRIVSMLEHSAEPDCPKCKAWVEADDAEAKALAQKWDEETAAQRAAGGSK
jgi:hypothetical protein